MMVLNTVCLNLWRHVTRYIVSNIILVLVKLGSEASTQEINGDNAVWSARNHPCACETGVWSIYPRDQWWQRSLVCQKPRCSRRTCTRCPRSRTRKNLKLTQFGREPKGPPATPSKSRGMIKPAIPFALKPPSPSLFRFAIAVPLFRSYSFLPNGWCPWTRRAHITHALAQCFLCPISPGTSCTRRCCRNSRGTRHGPRLAPRHCQLAATHHRP
jgi:hypothetical protein